MHPIGYDCVGTAVHAQCDRRRKDGRQAGKQSYRPAVCSRPCKYVSIHIIPTFGQPPVAEWIQCKHRLFMHAPIFVRLPPLSVLRTSDLIWIVLTVKLFYDNISRLLDVLLEDSGSAPLYLLLLLLSYWRHRIRFCQTANACCAVSRWGGGS